MTISPVHLRPGEVLRGKYRVEKLLGSGGMGTVVLATHLRLAQPVALKFLRSDRERRPDVLARFVREARAAARLRGEHAVRILDVDDSDGGDPFIVMEFLQGIDLEQYLLKQGPLAVQEAVDLLLQACAGIAEAHALGMVHRDLKPANLFLTDAHGGSIVKLLDFGIAKALVAEPSEALFITEPTSTMGSPAYMSPEQLRNPAEVDARSDIWSLGVVLYQLLCSALPFEATNTAALAARIVADPPQPLLLKRSDVPAALEQVIFRCLEKPPQNRYQNVVTFAEALAPFARKSQSTDGAARVGRAFVAVAAATADSAALIAKAPPLEADVRAGTASLHDLSPPSPVRVQPAPLAAAATHTSRRGYWWSLPLFIALAFGWWRWTNQPRLPVEIVPTPGSLPPPPQATPAVDAGLKQVHLPIETKKKPHPLKPLAPARNPLEIPFR